MIELYAIKHEPTGKFIPPIPKGHRRGGSWVEPEDTIPRLFPSHKAARSFLGQWLMGRHKKTYLQGGDFGEETIEEVIIEKVPERNKEAMKIVKFRAEEVVE